MHELMTLIDLSTGTRLPQYEVEIFSDLVLAEYYLRRLCKQHGWYRDGTHGVPSMAYCYAKNVMKSRWPEAEAIIATDPRWAYFYADYVMKSRWPEAEATIITDPYWACNYGIWVMKSRWPEAEAAISSDRDCREWYNEEFGTNI